MSSSSSSNNTDAAASWAELHSDIVCEILVRLDLIDFIRCTAVCSSWNNMRSSSNCRPKPSQLPWLMFSSTDSPDSRYFYSLPHQRLFEIRLPHVSGHHIFGSSDGLLVSIDDEARFHVTNPLTRGCDEDALLPSPVTLPEFHDVARDPSTGRITDYLIWDDDHRGTTKLVPYDTRYMHNYFFSKAVVSPTATNPPVFIIYSDREFIAFAKPGDTSWNPLKCELLFITDLIFHRGRLHAIDFHGTLVIFDGMETTFVSSRGPVGHHSGIDKRYLVESPDGSHLFLVHRDMRNHDGQPKPFNRTVGFQVFLLDDNTYKWVPIKDIGDASFFLGYNRSVALSTREFSILKRNCIYFTDDLKLLYLVDPGMAGDMGIYDMGDGSIHPLVPETVDHEHLNWPPALWFTPVLP